MKYARIALRDACDKALQQDAEHWLARREKHLAEHAKMVAEWNRRHAQEWAAAGLTVRRAVREGQPVTKAMLPRDRRFSDSVATFAPQYNFDRDYEAPVELLFLRRVLDVVTDDIVTTSGLAQVGVSTKTMRDAAWHMAVGSAKE